MKNACPVCQEKIEKVRFTSTGYSYKQCQACGTLFVADTFQPDHVYSNYDESYYEAHLSSSGARKGYPSYRASLKSMQRTFHRRLEFVNQRVPTGALLDIGTAYGTFLQIAARQYECIGIEISRYSANIARHMARVAVAGIEHAPFRDGAFDVITMWDVIEHLSEPAQALAEVARLLKPAGFCFISTDDVSHWLVRCMGQKWWAIAPPLHLCHFSKKSIQVVAERVDGLEFHETAKDERTYEINEVVKHFGIAYQNNSLSSLGAWLESHAIGQLHISIRRPEQFIFVLRKKT